MKILDIFGNTASVKLEMHDWIDCMHMVRVRGEWKNLQRALGAHAGSQEEAEHAG